MSLGSKHESGNRMTRRVVKTGCSFEAYREARPSIVRVFESGAVLNIRPHLQVDYACAVSVRRYSLLCTCRLEGSPGRYGAAEALMVP
jgi:hypothetical protein